MRSKKVKSVPSWLPNWENPDEYPSKGKTMTPEKWAWEFLRRNPNYHKDYQRVNKMPSLDDFESYINSPKLTEFYEITPSLHKGETYKKYLARVGGTSSCSAHRDTILENYSIDPASNNIDPSISIPPDFTNTIYPEWKVKRKSSLLESLGVRQYMEISNPYEVVILFSLKENIERQLRTAKKILKAQDIEFRKGNIIPAAKKRKRELSYQTYLRVLDAKAVGASEKMITNTLYNGLDKANDAVQDAYAAAKKLRDGDYRLILGFNDRSPSFQTP